MEVKNKKMMFVMIFLVLALVSVTFVEGIDGILGWRLGRSNIFNYFNGKMILNYFMIFAVLFAITYLWALNKDTRPSGIMQGFFIAAIFAFSVGLTIFITKGQPVFLWDVSKLNIRWLFKMKTIFNALIVAAICLLVYNFWMKKEGEAAKGKTFAAAFIIIVISLFVASMVNYSADTPKGKLPEGVKYEIEDKYVDRWLWQYPQFSKVKLFLLGDTDKYPDGRYDHPETKEIKQGVLRFGKNGAGFMALFLGSILLIWLFTHYKVFGEHKTFQYGVPILLSALLANEPAMDQAKVMSYAFWTVLLILNNYFKKTGWGQNRGGTAFGLAYAIVETVYVAVVGETYIIGSKSFLVNFVYGLGIGFIWDFVLGKGGWLGAKEAAEAEASRKEWRKWIKSLPGKALSRLGRAISSVSPTRFRRLARWLQGFAPIEDGLAKLQKQAADILNDLIAAEATTPRTPATSGRINSLRIRFANKIAEIRAERARLAALRGP